MPVIAREIWEEARRLYEGSDLSHVAIAARVGVCRQAVGRRAKRDGWQRYNGITRGHARELPAGPVRTRVPTRKALLIRLYRACEAEIVAVEARFAAPGAEVEEKDARTLMSLARALKMLQDVERADGAAVAGTAAADAPAAAAERVDLGALRQKLADALRRLPGGGP